MNFVPAVPTHFGRQLAARGHSSGRAGDAVHRRAENLFHVPSVMFFGYRHHRPFAEILNRVLVHSSPLRDRREASPRIVRRAMGNPGEHGTAVGGGADSGDGQPSQHRPRRLHADLPAGGRIAALQTLEPFATGHVSWPRSSVGVLFLVLGRFLAVSLLLLAHAWWFFACICIYLHLFAFIFHLFPFFCCFFPVDGVY